MPQDAKKPFVKGAKRFSEMSSEDVEVQAIGDATDGRSPTTLPNTDGAEQDIEYREKRELALDERANDDPSKH